MSSASGPLVSRRSVLLRGVCACALCLPGAAPGRALPLDLAPDIAPGYKPADADERGFWHTCDELEEELAASSLRVKDADLQRYLSGVASRLLDSYAEGIRVYVMQSADFNAAMFPNGMMLINTGLLARARSEAQLASVMGHECGHYLLRHSVDGWRNRRTTAGVMAWVGVAAGAATGAASSPNTAVMSWYDIAYAVNSVLLASVFSFSRAQESDADAYGLRLIGDAGYRPEASAEVWSQLIEERKASAAARKARFSDNSRSLFSTHPPTEDRMEDLLEAAPRAAGLRPAGTPVDDRAAEWQRAIGPLRPMLLDEQIKQNDSGASLYIIENLARDGWTGLLRYCEGEVYRLRASPGDTELAAKAYAEAVAFADAPAAAFRDHGNALLRRGATEEGRQALRRYLELAPLAPDAEMVRFTLGQ